MKSTPLLPCLFFLFIVDSISGQVSKIAQTDPSNPAAVFMHPPESAKPGVLWMWMGSNLSKKGITKDLEALKKAGFNRTTMFSLADITTPWAGEIGKSPTPEIVSWTEPWWQLVRYAAEESKRLGMDFGMFNGPSYESSGGTWITPELSMQEICWSKQTVRGGGLVNLVLERPTVDPRAHQPFPVYNPETGLVEKPVIAARKTYYKDIAVLALPATAVVAKDSVIDITAKMKPDGTIVWEAPAGKWMIYRFGHTTMGTLIQPAQWKATGLECDKMSQTAVDFHMDHVIGEIQRHLGDLIGTGFTHVHFDSYEAGDPTWTPAMAAAFLQRRGYDLTPFLPIFAGRNIGGTKDSLQFRKDFTATIKDLYRDIYFTTLAKKLKEAHLRFLCEPYGGPWRQEEIMPLVQDVMTEFWTHGGKYSPYELKETVAALRKSGQNIIEAEAFTGDPKDSKWTETPAWLKPIGDAAFCAGVNRMVLHRFVEQPWDDAVKPGATMGQWGTHFDRTQTWWNAMPSLVTYWQRCQALLQWGKIVLPAPDDFTETHGSDSIVVKSIHRRNENTDVYFIANTSHKKGTAACTFNVTGMQPECWDPVTASMKHISSFEINNGKTVVSIPFDDAQSFFIVFRNKIAEGHAAQKKAVLRGKDLIVINRPWQVAFDPLWGGPSKAVVFRTLEDWTKNKISGIQYYSGTASYTTSFDGSSPEILQNLSHLYLDLGVVKELAQVVINGHDLGFVWTAPWRVKIPAVLLKKKNNRLQIRVTNTWANRLIGDEQEPADCEWLTGHMNSGSFLKEFPDWFLKKQPRPSKNRFCFTTWNYFSAASPLLSAGLLGPVRLTIGD